MFVIQSQQFVYRKASHVWIIDLIGEFAPLTIINTENGDNDSRKTIQFGILSNHVPQTMLTIVLYLVSFKI